MPDIEVCANAASGFRGKHCYFCAYHINVITTSFVIGSLWIYAWQDIKHLIAFTENVKYIFAENYSLQIYQQECRSCYIL